MPRRHVRSFTDLRAQELEQLARDGQLVANALKASIPGCEGVTLSLADGEAVGQEVPHVHLHVIPRQAQDGFGWRFPPGYGGFPDRSELDRIAARIQGALPSL